MKASLDIITFDILLIIVLVPIDLSKWDDKLTRYNVSFICLWYSLMPFLWINHWHVKNVDWRRRMDIKELSEQIIRKSAIDKL